MCNFIISSHCCEELYILKLLACELGAKVTTLYNLIFMFDEYTIQPRQFYNINSKETQTNRKQGILHINNDKKQQNIDIY